MKHKNEITHGETQFERTVSAVDGSTSASTHSVTFTTEVAASPTLINKYNVVLNLADLMMLAELSYIHLRCF